MTSLTRLTRPAPLRRGIPAAVLAVGTAVAVVAFWGLAGTSTAFAAQPSVGLGTAEPFAVLAGTTVTNTGPSVVSGDLGVSPGEAVTGFPPGQVIHGTEHAGDAVALQAQSDLVTAYDDAAGRTPATTVPGDLGGKTLAPGVYKTAGPMGLTGTVTLDAEGDPNAVFIFQAGSTLITASSSTVEVIGGGQGCNVFWQVGSSATLGTDTTFVGTVMALTSATLATGATVDGRILARNGQVSLDRNTITRPTCTTAPPTTAPTTAPPTTAPTVPVPTVIEGGLASGQGAQPPSSGSSSPGALAMWLVGGLTGVALFGAGAGALLRRHSRDAA